MCDHAVGREATGLAGVMIVWLDCRNRLKINISLILQRLYGISYYYDSARFSWRAIGRKN